MKFLKNLFSKNNKLEDVSENQAGNNSSTGKVIEIYSPLSGTIIDLSEVPDEAFSQGILGDGVGIEPDGKEDKIYSPCNKSEVGIFETKHAVTFETEEGLELIVHFGIDTVQLEGQGFEQLVKSESKVTKGKELIKFDLNYIKSKVKSTRTPVIITNMDIVDSIEKMSGTVKPGDLLMRIKLK